MRIMRPPPPPRAGYRWVATAPGRGHWQRDVAPRKPRPPIARPPTGARLASPEFRCRRAGVAEDLIPRCKQMVAAGMPIETAVAQLATARPVAKKGSRAWLLLAGAAAAVAIYLMRRKR